MLVHKRVLPKNSINLELVYSQIKPYIIIYDYDIVLPTMIPLVIIIPYIYRAIMIRQHKSLLAFPITSS